jgi:pimeloyl-ACP methyl ester carboxylesterase
MVPDPERVAAMHDAGYGLMGSRPLGRTVMTEVRRTLLADVSCPIWLVNGQFDQLRVHVRAFEEAARSSPHVEVVTIPRALPSSP